jgi:hypothetical protein
MHLRRLPWTERRASMGSHAEDDIGDGVIRAWFRLGSGPRASEPDAVDQDGGPDGTANIGATRTHHDGSVAPTRDSAPGARDTDSPPSLSGAIVRVVRSDVIGDSYVSTVTRPSAVHVATASRGSPSSNGPSLVRANDLLSWTRSTMLLGVLAPGPAGTMATTTRAPKKGLVAIPRTRTAMRTTIPSVRARRESVKAGRLTQPGDR